MRQSDVLVIDGRGELNTALWGELTTLAALRKGLAGVVRDRWRRPGYRSVRRSPFPGSRRAVCSECWGRRIPGELNVPVQCGGQVIHPRDIFLALLATMMVSSWFLRHKCHAYRSGRNNRSGGKGA